MVIQEDGSKRVDGQNQGIATGSWLAAETPAWMRYSVAVASVFVGILLDVADLLSGGFRIYLVFYPFIVIATLFGGFGPGMLAIALSGLAATFFLIEPVGRLAIASRADAVSMAVFISGSLFVVWVCERLRRAIRQVAQAEARSETALELARRTQLLKESEERLALALQAGDVGVFDWDIALDKVVWTSQQEDLHGLPNGEFKGNHSDWMKRVHPEDEPRLALFFEQWMQSGPEKERWIYRVVRPDGKTRWIAAQGVLFRDAEAQPIRMIGANRDVTEHRRMEDALRESESRCWSIFENVVDAMVIIDEHGIIESANPAALGLFGYSAEEMKGQNVKMLMPSPYREHHDEYLDNYRRTGQRKIIGIGREVEALHRDGSLIPVRLAVSEMRVGNRRLFTGQIIRVTAPEPKAR